MLIKTNRRNVFVSADFADGQGFCLCSSVKAAVHVVVGLLCCLSALAEPMEVIISAPRLDDLDLMAVDMAADVTVIDREAIDQSGATSVAEVLQQQANIYLRSYSGKPSEGEISMRGFGENSGLRVLVLVDGHAMNRPDMGALEWQQIPLSNVESIEVMRGGQNVLYGNHALAGVIKITSKRGGERAGSMTGSVGSYGYRRGSANYSDSVGDSFFSLGLDSYTDDGFRSNSASRATSTSGSLGWYLNDTDVLTLRGAYSDSFMQYPGALSTNVYAGDFNETQSGLITLLWETEREKGAGRVSSGFSFRDTDWALGNQAHQTVVGLSLGPRYRFGDEDDFLMAGADFKYDAIDQENFLDEERDIVKSQAELARYSVAPYLFAQRKLPHDFTLNGGVRYEQAQTDNFFEKYDPNQLDPFIDTFIGPIANPYYKNPPDIVPEESYDKTLDAQGWAAELSLAYELSKESSVWMGYDRVYRYPSLDEVAAYSSYELSDPLNEDLEPEAGNNVEIGAKYADAHWLFSLTGFYLGLENEIAFNNNRNLNENIGATRRFGADVEAGYQLKRAGVSTRWSFVDARLDYGENAGNFVPAVPWATGVTELWVKPMDALRLSFLYTLVSEQYQGGDLANNRDGTSPKVDAYGLLGLGANWQMDEYLRLSFNVHNLLDEDYMAAAYGGAFYPGSGRRVTMAITFGF